MKLAGNEDSLGERFTPRSRRRFDDVTDFMRTARIPRLSLAAIARPWFARYVLPFALIIA